jgi:hypothetical protein
MLFILEVIVEISWRAPDFHCYVAHGYGVIATGGEKAGGDFENDTLCVRRGHGDP